MEEQIRFLYWNTCNKIESVEKELICILAKDEIHILILAESKKSLSEDFCKTYGFIEQPLNVSGGEFLKQRIYKRVKPHQIDFIHLNNIPDTEIEDRVIQYNISGTLIDRVIKNIARVVLLELTVNTRPYLLACVHFPSKKNLDEVAQLQAAHNYKRFILERSYAYNDKVIIIGDFNMNPFDAGMVEPHGFYALNYNEIVKNKKVFQHSIEQMLYNPCWMLLGDNDKAKFKLTGSHYFEGSPSKKLFWHLFDQVILSKNMIDQFVHSDLEVIEIPSLIAELTKQKPDRQDALYSDHLPIKFTLKL